DKNILSIGISITYTARDSNLLLPFGYFQISHAISCCVHLRFDITKGSDIELAIKGICGTSVAHFEPERNKDFPYHSMFDQLKVQNKKKEFPLTLGWALKENQKLGKKGAGKRISKHVIAYLEGYFLAGNADKSDRYSAEDMWKELNELAKGDSLEESDIPKVSTIQNWIARYTTQHKQKAVQM
ncbi:18087_t:CDS:2, partial [Cetraspora pellucida]